ncbi:hypothetical protein AD954_08625 [Acetobacter cerevisiae]|uniref:Uncharacterized protein n=2 Tax=Acetobacteraceae TaxID=433 RepID=A0A149VAI6_9PROT|nr:hypothetical protein AD954_08625 [Acetobacter cerevisiae]
MPLFLHHSVGLTKSKGDRPEKQKECRTVAFIRFEYFLMEGLMKHILFTLCLIAPLMLTSCAGGHYHHRHDHGPRPDWNNNSHNHPPPRPMLR